MTTPSQPELLTRTQFREGVFARDGYRCVLCGSPAADAHHIIERRLFSNGGYYLDNGASVCEPCHLRCEQTVVSCEELRTAAGITRVVLPDHLYDGDRFDKWGNVVLANGQRMRGELFFDESVQKVLAPVLHLFTPYVKYPRTHHLPWSEGRTEDDRGLDDLSGFVGEDVVVTVKMDGAQRTMYRDYTHGRSIDGRHHAAQAWVKNFHAQIAHDIPEGWRLCGEDLFAKHTIHYRHLPAFFLLFSIWNEHNRCLSWDETTEWAALIGVQTVPVLYRGPWDERLVRGLHQPERDDDPCEGYVVRVAREFSYGEFRRVVGKYVRRDHVHTHAQWLQRVVPNELARDHDSAAGGR